MDLIAINNRASRIISTPTYQLQLANMAKILVVEDDREISSRIHQWLLRERYTVDVVHDGLDAYQLIANNIYDLLILDWELPGSSGLELCRKLRKDGSQSLILMLTGRSGLSDKTQGLDSGADDYLVKPFQLEELSSRIRALLRRQAPIQSAKIEFADLSMDRDQLKVWKNGEEISLRPKEFALLELFLKNPDRVMSSEMILKALWPGDSGAGDEDLRALVKNLRKKITRAGEDCPVRNVFAVGYKLSLKD
jgi:DNA-binding response OmpR family regulator